VYSALAP